MHRNDRLWDQYVPPMMRAISALGHYPGHLDGTARNALEQRDKQETVGLSVLRSKEDPRVLAQLVLNPHPASTGWFVLYRNPLKKRAVEQIAIDLALSGKEHIPILGVYHERRVQYPGK